MIHTPGAAQTSGAEVVAYAAPSSRKTAIKRVARMVGAGVISAGMVGIFALPAYATPEVEGIPDGFANATQTLQASEFESDALPGSVAPAEVDASIAERARAEEAAAAAAQAAAAGSGAAAFGGADVPAGVGAGGLVTAALAQVGQAQDCTALVERSLRAIGFGVGDLGTLIGHYTPYGSLVTSGGYAPGDILIWEGRHVAIYIGNGQAVHGGFGGNMTVVASAFMDGTPSAVVRVG